jgi:hypothetical protein
MTRFTPDRRVSADVPAEAIARRRTLAAEGELLEFTQFHERSGLSRQPIQQQLKTRALLTVDGPEGMSYCPAFFADVKYDQAAVRRIARALKRLPGDSKWVFFTSPRLSLDGLTPLEVISGAMSKRRDGDRTGGASVELLAVFRAAVGYVKE